MIAPSIQYTRRQAEVMGVIRDFWAEHGYAPTLKEIGAPLGICRVTVCQHVHTLMRKGAIERMGTGNRYAKIADPHFAPACGLICSRCGEEAAALAEEPTPGLLALAEFIINPPPGDYPAGLMVHVRKLAIAAVSEAEGESDAELQTDRS